MPLTTGTRLGSYEIQAPIGAGGMGEVYRAHDARLNRDVAIKVLPDLFVTDPERLARFEREAQVLAALNHPNIAHVYGLEDAGGVHALVMELVPGRTLAEIIAGTGHSPLGTGPWALGTGKSSGQPPGSERLPSAQRPVPSAQRPVPSAQRPVPDPHRQALPLSDALPIARQIADALEAAHEQGIIHRDLKPANIKVRDDGTVKVLDFGLAKALDPAGGSNADVMNSPTLTNRATQLGVILGTAAYMAPEQAKGKAVDRRVDVWAFGCVLYEMLTGRRPFGGEDISDTLAAVLKDEPDWAALPADVPAPIQRLLRRCLEKDPRHRFRSIGDALFDLDDAHVPPQGVGPLSATVASRPRIAWLLGAAATGAIVMGAAAWFIAPHLQTLPEGKLARLSVMPPKDVTLALDAAESALSPDGRALVFTAVDPTGNNRLWLRPIDSPETRALAGTEHGSLPFWSADSQQIAFFADGKLKKVAVKGGTVEVLCEAKDGRGGSWSATGTIVFSPTSASALQAISANGGDPKAVTILDTAHGETGHRFPWFLPDGRHFLFAVLPAKDGKFQIDMAALDSTTRSPMLAAESAPVYAPPGYLLFARKNALVAQRFDAGRLQLSGEPVSLGDRPGDVGTQWASGRAATASATGALAYLMTRQVNTTLAWLDRSGRQVATVDAPAGLYTELRIAPDGRRAAVVRTDSPNESDLWMVDLARGGATRFTSGPGQNFDIVWSPDSSRVVFSRMFSGPRVFFTKPATGAAPEELLFKSAATFKDPSALSPDGKLLVFSQLDSQTNRDLWLLPLEGARTPKPYRRTPFNEDLATISPDGRWVAYVANDSGRNEVYVDSFPTPTSAFQVTTAGGSGARWRADGKEIGLLAGDGRTLLTANVDAAGTSFHATAPRLLVTLPKGTLWAEPTRDLQRFLISVPTDDSVGSSMTVVLDWLAALKKN